MSEDRKFIVTYVDGAAITTIRVGDTITFSDGLFDPAPTRWERIRQVLAEIGYRFRTAWSVLLHGD